MSVDNSFYESSCKGEEGIWEEANKEREVVNTEQRRDKKILSLKRQEGTGSRAPVEVQVSHMKDSSHGKRKKGRNNVCGPR